MGILEVRRWINVTSSWTIASVRRWVFPHLGGRPSEPTPSNGTSVRRGIVRWRFGPDGRRMANTITIRVRLEDGEPTALAKLCARFGYEQAAAPSDSPEERRAMESAILKIQAALDRKAAGCLDVSLADRLMLASSATR
jgi:hypothetical protein